ncbi:MAG: Na+/H+ antiporter NhaC family protein [Planctomycetota bacterium]|nr:MAG: Na+/H+ antiporter NhaC family protein [Planctomycetota bacterium]
MDATVGYGWISLVPPLLTIVLAIALRRVILALLIGIATGVLIQLPAPQWNSDGSWIAYVGASGQRFCVDFFESHLWHSLSDPDHQRVFVFTSLLGMQVALIHRAGGMQGIVHWAAPLARSRRGGQLLTWFLGLVIFIDDYANTLLLGSTMRPIADRLKISREKLAFLVDSTAAPVSGLALVSTWVATEISTMETGFQQAGIDISGQTFGLFLETIPVRFYILFALLFVFLVAVMNRDFGPMLRAERAAQSGTLGRQGVVDEQAVNAGRTAPNAWNAIVPIGITVAVVVWLLVVTGQAESGVPRLPQWTDWRGWGQVVGSGDSYLSLVYGALAGLLVIIAMIRWQDRLTIGQIHAALAAGFAHVVPAMVILWLAWTLSRLTDGDHLATGQFLASRVQQLNLPVAWMPTVVFILSSAIAFSTGTSWGTMAIVMPMVIPLVYGLLPGGAGTAESIHDPALVGSIGSVLAGAIFGDHCSPISDTTILSSRSSDCDHIAHVRTQMPYALLVAGVSILCGTLPAAVGVSSWILLPLGGLCMVLALWWFGRPVDAEGC